MNIKLTISLLIVAIAASHTAASAIEFTDKSEWEAAVGAFTTLDFDIQPQGTPITNQYAHLGVNVTGAAFSHSAPGYVNDEWGMFASGGAWVHFNSPQNWVAVDYPGEIQIQLFQLGVLIYTSTYFVPSGTGNFAGLWSPIPFDEVHLRRLAPSSVNVFIDDLHFGALVPGPSALGLLGIACIFPRRRRRR